MHNLNRGVACDSEGERTRRIFRAPKALQSRGIWSGGMLPQKSVKFRVSEMPFPTIFKGLFKK